MDKRRQVGLKAQVLWLIVTDSDVSITELQLVVHLEGRRAELQTFLHVLLKLILDADLLFFGQCGHWKSSDHCLLSNWLNRENTTVILCC